MKRINKILLGGLICALLVLPFVGLWVTSPNIQYKWECGYALATSDPYYFVLSETPISKDADYFGNSSLRAYFVGSVHTTNFANYDGFVLLGGEVFHNDWVCYRELFLPKIFGEHTGYDIWYIVIRD